VLHFVLTKEKNIHIGGKQKKAIARREAELFFRGGISEKKFEKEEKKEKGFLAASGLHQKGWLVRKEED